MARPEIRALAMIATRPGISAAEFACTVWPDDSGCGVAGLKRHTGAKQRGGSILERLRAAGWVRVEHPSGIVLAEKGVRVLQEQGLAPLLNEAQAVDVPGLVFIRGHRHPDGDTMTR